jgi:hypothetical protein
MMSLIDQSSISQLLESTSAPTGSSNDDAVDLYPNDGMGDDSSEDLKS